MSVVAQTTGPLSIDFVPIVALALVVYTLTNAAKFITNRDWKQLVTLLLAWVIGVCAVWLFGATAWGNQIQVGEKTLDLLSFWDKVVVGLVVTSAGSTIYDFKRSFDRSDSSAMPALIPTRPGSDAASEGPPRALPPEAGGDTVLEDSPQAPR